MSDANKSMIDASGRLIRGVTHPYVLADDLYPMLLIAQSYVVGYRGGTPAGQWTSDWNMNEWMEAYYYYGWSFSTHSAWSQVIGTNTIDWARVKKITWKIDFLSLTIAPGLTVKVTKSKNNSTFPAGTVIRDDWDTVAEYTETGNVPLTIEWDINGVEPTSLEYAIMFTADEGSNDGYGEAFSFYWAWVTRARIVYNLAT